DQEADPAIMAIIGASTALTISNIPFQGPIGAVRIGYLDDQLVVNPSVSKMGESQLDLVVAGTRDAIIMVEAGAKEVPEATIVEGMRMAQREIARICDMQEAFAREVGKPKIVLASQPTDPEIDQAVDAHLAERLDQALFNPNKSLRESALDDLKKETINELGPRFVDRLPALSKSFEAKVKQRVRAKILNDGMRPDGRKTTEIRQITSEVGLLPRTHGSALFTRGQTQALSIVTLGSIGDKQKLDGLGLEEYKRFMHHYNFPPFSVGEARPLRSPGRREIGHGALAERALLPVVPTEEEFPYTIRVVTEILSSNGSTSMASVCGSSLAMMDAGVPTRGQVAGIAMGLITGEGGKVAVLSDIQGVEDALGDMDFKVAGTASGVTAMQMDMKIKGIGVDVLAGAIQQAKDGRMFIMDKMNEALTKPRAAMSRYAPRMITVQIHPDKIREVIGPGGKMIRKIIEDSGVTSIDIEDDGRVIIGSVNEESGSKAEQIIRDLTGEVEVGKNYKGKVVRIMPFGAFVQIMPNQDGLVHISQLAENRIDKVEDAVNVGDDIEVKVTEVDRQGRVNLSRKAVLQEAKGITNGDWVVTERDRGGPPRGGSSGGFNRGGGDRGPRRDFDRGPRGGNS
ncbi:MAG: polyribonucleotide nucleotidyltransferase, partial [Candidatus Dormibacteraeota bacterium]|nr:polyribonucleotide nucleotidyltransferase [Candidatus Dormibacteraeota bacterium]